MLKRGLALIAALALAACTNANDLDKEPVHLGDFRLGHNIVVTKNMVKGPVSREATGEEWEAALEGAIAERFDRYDGAKQYHFGVAILGYVLARPGVPIVASPKSALIVSIDVWDDAKGVRLQSEPEQITALESFSGGTFLGSGLTQSKEQQMENLSRNAAKLIQNYLERQLKSEGWFTGTEDTKSVADQPLEEKTDADTPPVVEEAATDA